MWSRLRRFYQGLHSNIRLLVGVSLTAGVYQTILMAVRQPFVLSLGASMRLLGFLESLGGWGGLVSSAMQLIGGWQADRVGRRPLILLASLSALLGLLFYVLAAALHAWPLLLPATVLLGCGMLGTAARNALTAESASPQRRALAYSAVMFAFILPGALFPILGGRVADRWGYLPIMLLSLACEGLVLLLLLRFLKETRSPNTPPSGQKGWRDLSRLLRVPRSHRRLILPFAADAFSWGLALSLLFGILSDAYGFTDTQLGWISAAMSVSWALTQLPVGRLIDRYGCKRFILLSEALGILCILILLRWPTFTGVALAYLLFGFTAALWMPAQSTLLAGSVPEVERAEAMGRVSTVQGLARFPAPYLAGWFYEWRGYPAPLLAGLVGVVVATVLIAMLLQDPPPEER